MLRTLAATFAALAAGTGIAVSAPAAAPNLPDLFTPAPVSSTSPLPEIGRVRASVCRPIVGWSANASESATKNDTILNGLAETLPEMQLDDYAKPKQVTTMQKLMDTASDVRMRARDGQRATSNIRAYANSLMDLNRRAAIVAYVDALEDALRTQETTATDMQRALIIAEGRRATFEAKMQMANSNGMGTTVVIDEPGSYHYALNAISQRIDERQADVRRAERTVAEKAKQVHC